MSYRTTFKYYVLAIICCFLSFNLQANNNNEQQAVVITEQFIKDIIMLVGGLFLLYKATTSIHEEVSKSITIKQNKTMGFAGAISQIIFIDLIFSLDSLITAIGITSNLIVIALAIVISIIFMLIFAGKVSEFIAKHPSLKMLALSFILMIGVFLMLEGLSIYVEKGYIYFAMGFSLVVELLNIFIKSKQTSYLK